MSEVIVNPTTTDSQPQLTPGQRKLLLSLPRNLHEKPLRGVQKTTVSNLYAMGLVETRGLMAHQKTLCLTDAGRAALQPPATAPTPSAEPVTTHFVYGTINRPAGYGTVPDGRLIDLDDHKGNDTYYSIVTYDRKLTPEELYKWEMYPISGNAYQYPIGARVIVNEVDDATITAHLERGRYGVRYDETDTDDNVHVKQLADPDVTRAQSLIASVAVFANAPQPADAATTPAAVTLSEQLGKSVNVTEIGKLEMRTVRVINDLIDQGLYTSEQITRINELKDAFFDQLVKPLPVRTNEAAS